MEEQIISNEQTADQPAQPPKRGRYGLWIRVTALFLVIAMLLGIMTNVDFSLLRYQGTDQMVAAEYLMDTTPYLGSSRIQRLKSLLTSVDAFSINLQAAEIAIGKTDYDRAAKFLNKCIPLSPDELQKAELYNRLGCVYMLAEDSAQYDIIVAAVAQCRTFSQSDIALLFFGDLRQIGGKTDVDGKADMGIYGITSGGRTAQTDLFLDGSDTVNGDIEFAFGEAAHGFCDDECTDFVIGSFGNKAVFVEHPEIFAHDYRIADGNEFFGFFTVFRTDIDPHIFKVESFFPF